MRIRVLPALLCLALPSASVAATSDRACTPTLAVLEERISLAVGASELSFRLVAVGCGEDLARVWPPALDVLKRELQLELSEPHPVEVLFQIRDHKAELRRRVTKRLNSALGRLVVEDVFLYDARASE